MESPWEDIRCAPTIIKNCGQGGVHESVFRSFQILCEVKRLIEQGTPGPVLLEIIADLESRPGREFQP